jgi:hypothetical protein
VIFGQQLTVVFSKAEIAERGSEIAKRALVNAKVLSCGISDNGDVLVLIEHEEQIDNTSK